MFLFLIADLTNESAAPAGEIRMKNLHNPVYDATEQENEENGKEAVYSQPDTTHKKTLDKPPGPNGGKEQEREFKNSIYGHDLVSSSYSKPTSSDVTGQNSVTAPNGVPPHQQSTSTGPVQNGEATYAMVKESNYDTADGNSQRYDVTHAPLIEEDYDVAHLPDDDQYDVARPPASQTTPSNQDASRLLNNQYDVAHPPADEQYDVTRAPIDPALYPSSNEYDVAHLASDIYTEPTGHASEIPRDDDDYDVAHLPPGTSGLQGQEEYDVAHPVPRYEMVDVQGDYDVAIVPGSVGNGGGRGHLEDNPRYESTDLPPADVYCAPNAPSATASSDGNQYSVFNRN